ncbi:electron transport complex subunit RsxG [Natronospirillum operosum]|uniref:Ion-translocating oxidoreductase complex subunit G n=1 Tax=Natronospirillum operosum TaxID=2759953 RepID=A0A4Z0W9M3_9GAMM|nr:electron transport complex subunit RsxG [Natronospirillum operosum]TGG95319.1 electron transport complex subunit RsxG [Natronospirillum operosum]
MITSPMLRHAIGLGLFAVFTAGLIAVVHTQTRDRAAANAEAYAARTLYELVPADYFSAPIEDSHFSILEAPRAIAPERLSLRRDRAAFRAIRNDAVTAVVLPVTAPQGYTGDIDLLMAIEPDGTLLGVRVVAHQETPGLGDAIEADRSDWILQFDGTSLSVPPPEQWAVRKDDGDFDQLTGATITPRAVVNAVRIGLEFFADNREWLLAE